MTSIRARTAAWVALSTTTLLTLGGLVLFLVLRQALTSQFDDALSARAAALQSLTRFDGRTVEMDIAGEAMPRYAPGVEPEYFVAWVREGDRWRPLERSESLSADDWPPATLDAVGVANLSLPDRAPGRGIMIEFPAPLERDEEREHSAPPAKALASPSEAPHVRLLVALSRRPLDRSLSIVGWSIAGVGALLAVAGIAASRWAVARGLVPLSRLSDRVHRIGPDTLDARFDPAGFSAELRPIAQQLNDLLARLQAAFEREKRFSAAASHELRTPLAELRMLLDVAASRPRSSEEWSATGATALGVLDRAQSLCESLLRLSRAGAERPDPASQNRIDVAKLLAEQADRALSTHGGNARRIRIEAQPGVIARADPAVLASIIRNLIDNALGHGRVTPEAPALIRASTADGRCRIEVLNAAPELTAADVPRLFEPFWRKDESRADQSGFGLGLPVARALARASAGQLTADLVDDSLRLTLDLPAADQAALIANSSSP